MKPVYTSLNEQSSTNKESNISPIEDIEEFMSEQKAKINKKLGKKLVKDDYHMNLAQVV